MCDFLQKKVPAKYIKFEKDQDEKKKLNSIKTKLLNKLIRAVEFYKSHPDEIVYLKEDKE